jgi:hypothetical protein
MLCRFPESAKRLDVNIHATMNSAGRPSSRPTDLAIGEARGLLPRDRLQW